MEVGLHTLPGPCVILQKEKGKELGPAPPENLQDYHVLVMRKKLKAALLIVSVVVTLGVSGRIAQAPVEMVSGKD